MHKNKLRWVNRYFLLGCLIILLTTVIPGAGAAADNGKLLISWSPPTTMGDTCSSTVPITGTWSYTVDYRMKGGTTWVSVEVATSPYSLTGLAYNTTYEIRVGAHRAGQAVLCPGSIVEATTKSEPAPGACSNLVLTPQ